MDNSQKNQPLSQKNIFQKIIYNFVFFHLNYKLIKINFKVNQMMLILMNPLLQYFCG